MGRNHFSTALLTSALLFGVSSIAIAQQTPAPAQPQRFDIGKIEYESKCATCHGTMGKGDGPTAPYLNRDRADLTTLAKNNGGVFPVVAMYETITGERQYAGHGTREMPVWGEFYVESPYIQPEAYMRARILAIMEYVNRLQAK